MTRLKMHWELIQGADGKKFLSMQWEAAQAGVMPACARTQINRSATRKAA